MSQPSQQVVRHILQNDSTALSNLFKKVKEHEELQILVAQCLNEKLATHFMVVEYENSSLGLITPNALWATQIRFQIPDLLRKLRKFPQFSQLKTIKCKIIPSVNPAKPTETNSMQQLSNQAADSVLAIANTIKDERLQSIMKRIATHRKKV